MCIKPLLFTVQVSGSDFYFANTTKILYNKIMYHKVYMMYCTKAGITVFSASLECYMCILYFTTPEMSSVIPQLRFMSNVLVKT